MDAKVKYLIVKKHLNRAAWKSQFLSLLEHDQNQKWPEQNEDEHVNKSS